MKCLLNGVETKALWDTGAQVSIIPSNWVRKFYPGTDVRNIAELLGLGGLDLKTANGTDLPYKGWVELTFSLAEENSQRSLQVRGTQREYSSKPLKHNIVKRILVFKR